MSDAATHPAGALFEGYVTVRELAPRGMITVRGELGSAAMKKAVKAATGTAVPGVREVLAKDEKLAAWMSPDELLIVLPGEETAAAVEAFTAALDGVHSLVADVSDARASFGVEGAGAREVLAKLLPVDLHPDAFATGMIRRSHCAQAPAAIWMTGPEQFELICFRSVGQYVFQLLCASARPGSEVGIY